MGDVEYAILETSGNITVIQKPEKRNTIPEDFNIVPDYEGISYDLVVDGKIMDENLKKLFPYTKKSLPFLFFLAKNLSFTINCNN